MKDIKEIIFEILNRQIIPLKRSILLEMLQAQGHKETDCSMRKIVAEMIIKNGYLIGTDNRGYFIIRTRTDLDCALRQLEIKAKSISIRKNCLLNIFEKKYQGQLNLLSE